MKHTMVTVFAVLALASSAAAQQVDNPAYAAWVKFNEGSMARYTGNTKTMGMDTTIESSITLKSKSSDRVVVEIRRKVTTQGDTVEEPVVTQAIPAKVPPERAPKQNGEVDLENDGKVLRCRIYERGEVLKEGINLMTRTWMSDTVPGGVVRIESKTEGHISMNTFIDLKEFKAQ